MSRFIFQSHYQDQNGKAVSGGTITVTLAGTNTPTIIYPNETGAAHPSNTVLSDSIAKFQFYIDTADYPIGQRFKLKLSKNGHQSVEYDDVVVTVADLTSFSAAIHNHSDNSNGGGILQSTALLTPTIASFVNSSHNHSDAINGGVAVTAQHNHSDASGGGNTLVTPTIASFTNAQHNHSDASSGGGITNMQTRLPIGSTIMFDAAGWVDDNTIPGWFACIPANAGVGCPDLTSQFVMGDTVANRGATGGSNSKIITTAEMPSHTHTLSSHSHIVNAHSHTVNAHSHTVNSHTHGGGNHTHSINHSHPQGTTNPTSLTHFHQTFNTDSGGSVLTASNFPTRSRFLGPSESYEITGTATEANIGRTSTFNDNHTHTFSAPTFSGSSGGGSATTAAASPGTANSSPGTTNTSPGTGAPSNNTSGSTGSGTSWDSRPSFYSLIFIRRCT